MLDARELLRAWPAEIRESTEAARAIRANPITKAFIEALLIERSTGSTVGFTEKVAMDCVKRHAGELGVELYRSAEAASHVAELLELAEGHGWKTSPLSVGLTMTHRLGQLYAAAPHLRLISDAVVDAFTGRGPRTVIVSLPSRYGKSELAGRRTLEWFFANYPGLPAIYLTATEDAASSMGRLVRNDLALHEELLGFRLAEDSAAAGRWNTTIEGGQLISSGLFGQVLGRGAALMVCDDFFKNSEQGNSAVYRDSVWDLWLTSFQTRLQSGAVVVVIGTRFHSEDFIGRLLNGHGDARPVEARYIRLPALAEESDELGRAAGEPLPLGPVQVPGFGYTKEELEARRATSGAEVWATSYQQEPIDETAAGRAYHAFDPDFHVKPIEFDPDLTVHVSFDFNVDPLCVVLAQVREASDRWMLILANERKFLIDIFNELSLPDSNTQAACDELGEKLRKLSRGKKLRLVITGDASGAQRRTSASKSDWEIVKKYFSLNADIFKVCYAIRRSNPGVRDRVAKVNSFLRSAIGERRLRIDPACRELIQDLKTMRWARDAHGNPRDTLDKRDPKRSHSSDALGYLVFSVGEETVYGEKAESLFF